MAVAPYEITAEVLRHPGVAHWHYLTLPEEVVDDILARFDGSHRAAGSLPVSVRLGQSVWTTSLYYDNETCAYLLPMKADVRRRERVGAGDTVAVTLAIKR